MSFMPLDSNWKMPFVRPSQKSWKTFGVVERHRVEVEREALALEDLQGVVDHGDRLQAEEVHLEQAELLDHLHVPLGGDFVAVGLVERHELLDRARRDDDAGGVHRGVAGQPLEAAADLDEPLDLGVASRSRRPGCRWSAPPRPATWSCPGSAWRRGRPRANGSPRTRPTSRSTPFAASVPKVMICATRSRAVLLVDVLDHLAAAAHAEVDVDVGHADALGIEEALEQQVVAQRVDVGDAQRVGDQRAGGRAAPGPDRDAALARRGG